MNYIPLLLSLASVLKAASYTAESSAVCTITPTDDVVNIPRTNGCHSGAGGSYAIAEADIYIFDDTSKVGHIPTVSISAGVTVNLADLDPSPDETLFVHESVYAEASSKITMFLRTGGPIRPGVLQSGLTQDPGPGGNASYEYYLPANFQLGTAFEMSLGVYARYMLLAADYSGAVSKEHLLRSSAGSHSFRFPRVYEADGVLLFKCTGPMKRPPPSRNRPPMH
jgi:hypothetical protein